MLMFLLLQGGPSCVSADWPAAPENAPPVRRKRSVHRRLYGILLQRLQADRAPSIQPSDYDYVDDQEEPPYLQRKRNTGRCYFHAINCW